MLEENKLSKLEKYTLVIICWITVLNYCNKSTAVFIAHEVKEHFSITEEETKYYSLAESAGSSIISPVYGYLGDRYSKRFLLMISIGIGSVSHFISSFSVNYRMIVVSRVFVGVGLSGLRNIGPPVIASIVSHETRTMLLAIFFICEMLGRGSGFIMGSLISKSIGCWWTLRVSLVFDIISIFLIYFGMYPESGAKDAAAVGKEPPKPTSYGRDLHSLLTNISYLLLILAYICVTFVCGALRWWGGDYLYMGLSIVFYKTEETITQLEADIYYEAIATITGVTGVIVGSTLSYYQTRVFPAADTIICGICLIVSLPFLTIALYTAGTNKIATLLFLFLGATFGHTNLAIVSDMLLYIVKPTRHVTCFAIVIVSGFLFGEMISPSILKSLRNYYELLAQRPNNWIHVQASQEAIFNDKTPPGMLEFRSLQMSLFTFLVIQLIGAVIFLVNKNFIVKYRRMVEEII